MADVFREVEEELRSAQLRAAVLRAWPYAAAAAVIALLAAVAIWGLKQHEIARDGAASVTYAQGLDALQHGDAATAEQRFSELARSAPKIYRSLALMQEAGIRLNQNKPAEAVKLFDQAAQAAPNEVLGDAARLKAAYVLMDTAPYGVVAERLKPLVAQNHPYRVLAREALALERLQAGRLAEARSDFQVLTLTSDASDQTRARAQAAVAMIDSGSAKALGQAVRIATTLPPPPAQATPTAAAPNAAAPSAAGANAAAAAGTPQ